jgi:hypothetical protein
MNTIVTVTGGNRSIGQGLRHELEPLGLESPVSTQTLKSNAEQFGAFRVESS